ncbi:flagellar motor switch protein FliN [Listeria monocytogenes]|uniref:Flagellar motor switch protein FliN n=1 Tax=Listeria monocytogenes TaxID=1639 RepID=A0A6V9TPU8_LISMN|nr:flagellar motor switch protein FliN [Listeria monocytogenes]EAC6873794.1 flagellar motor switch protein FliN [Listeria monocytogenes]EAC7885917.1 flagellar motor switch protein FliN [Listeria monocytogenes]EAC8433129.1 flagellar motor switch protein FliN [Listeria monocytogenes]EAC8463791.1 flagellar motor switch protein FliN [Listeria monocytogenes]EAD1932978.1 flagellar motor switch protein FliN [Listeria monocytogenes]
MKINHTIPLRIDFELGRTKQPVGSLLDVKKGTVFRLEDSTANVVKITISGKCIGYGEILTKDGKMFVKITKLGEASSS